MARFERSLGVDKPHIKLHYKKKKRYTIIYKNRKSTCSKKNIDVTLKRVVEFVDKFNKATLD